MAYLNYQRSLAANRQLVLINELYLPLSRLVVQMQGHIHGLAEDSKRLQALNQESSDRGTFSRMVRDLYPYLVFRKIAVAENLLQRNSGAMPDHRMVAAQLEALKQTFDRATTTTSLKELEPIYQEGKRRLQEISRVVDESCERVTAAAQLFARENLKWTALFSVVLLALGMISLAVSSRALRPLPQLIESIKKNATGDRLMAIKVGPNEQNEFGVLAREYNKMLLALSERDKKIQSQQLELLQSERLAAIGKLSAEIVHEVRNPLNSISLNIDWLTAQWKPENPECQKALNGLSREIVRLNEITERYLMQARVPERTEAVVDLNDLVTELVEFLNAEHRLRNIKIELHLHPGRVIVNADRVRLRQAFLNVFRNSREAMPRGGEIHIRSVIRNNICELAFEDSGCGMSDTTLQNVFRPFFSTKPNGNGLGLMLTRSAVEEAHGTFNIRSKMGMGTNCQMLFPASFA